MKATSTEKASIIFGLLTNIIGCLTAIMVLVSTLVGSTCAIASLFSIDSQSDQKISPMPETTNSIPILASSSPLLLEWNCKQPTFLTRQLLRTEQNWMTTCSMTNRSVSIINGTLFDIEGGRLAWSCFTEKLGSDCSASHLGQIAGHKDLIINGKNIKISFINSGESMNFDIYCETKPSSCWIDGKGAGVNIKKFQQ